MDKHLIAIVGMCGSGKSEITKMFQKEGYHYIHFGEITLKEVRNRGLQISEQNERIVREEIRKNYGNAAYAILALPEIIKNIETKNIVLDGLYSWSEYKYLKEHFNSLIVLAIVTNNSIRKKRLSTRSIRPLTNEAVDARDYSEIENLEKGGPIAIADYYIINNDDIDTLKAEFGRFILWLENH